MDSARREAGFALVTALWAALILALVVSFVVKAGRTDARIAHTALEQAKLHALAQGAIAMVELRLLAPLGPIGLPLDGTPVDFVYAGHQLTVSVRDQAGLIDLNFASAYTLTRLFETAGTTSLAAQTLADRILDWREKGLGRRLNGAKAPDYADAGFTYGPRDGPFQSVDELRLVMGVTSSLFDRIAPALTVYSQRTDVDLQTASAIVLATLPGHSLDDAAEDIHRREQARVYSSGNLPATGPITGRSLEIKADVNSLTNLTAPASNVIRATGYINAPFLVYREN